MEILALIFSVIAIIASGLVAFYTQHAMNQRERTKWEREELTKIVSELVSLSSQREQTISIEYWDAVGWPQHTSSLLPASIALQRMTPLAAQLELLAPGSLSNVAKRLIKEHDNSHKAAEDETNHIAMIENTLMSPGVLEALHENLALQFRAAIGNKKQAPELTEEHLNEIRKLEHLEIDKKNQENAQRKANYYLPAPQDTPTLDQ